MAPGENELTTIYLTASEFSIFNFSEMVIVEKTRYIVASNNHKIGIDEYGTGQHKIFIAEIEFSHKSSMESFTPIFADHVEVTHSIEYNGYECSDPIPLRSPSLATDMERRMIFARYQFSPRCQYRAALFCRLTKTAATSSLTTGSNASSASRPDEPSAYSHSH
jgi:hypothetical protein